MAKVYSPSLRKRIEVETLDTGHRPGAKSKGKVGAGPKGKAVKPGDRFMGAPISWWQRVLPLTKGSGPQLAVAIWLWRRRVVCGNRNTFSVPNVELKSLGVSPRTKHRALALLEGAGVIAVKRSGKAALTVTILPEKRRGKRREKTWAIVPKAIGPGA